MKIQNKLLFLHICLSLFITGCLGYEEEYLFIDISKKVGEVRYSHIVSNSASEEKIEEDFQDLIEMVYDDRHSEEEAEQKIIRISSRELYGIGPRLSGTVNFSFKDPEAALNEFNIKLRGNEYVYEMGVDEVYRGGNGTYREQNLKKSVRWDKQCTTIEFKKGFASFDQIRNTSLLSYWLDWKRLR